MNCKRGKIVKYPKIEIYPEFSTKDTPHSYQPLGWDMTAQELELS